jgi:hypothetical protein
VQIAKSSFLLAVVAGMNFQAMHDALKRISASTVTMRRFGPSGSWKKKNNALEHTNAVITRRSNDVFFDSKGILVIIKPGLQHCQVLFAAKRIASSAKFQMAHSGVGGDP